MNTKWFYGVVSSKKAFVEYLESTYTYQRLICIHPLELRDIAAEAIFHAKKFNVKLPDYFESMVSNPVAFSEEAINQGIDPEYSEVTRYNEEHGTEYRNMVEYMEDIHKHVKLLRTGDVNDPLTVMASDEDDAITDEEAYLQSLT